MGPAIGGAALRTGIEPSFYAGRRPRPPKRLGDFDSFLQSPILRGTSVAVRRTFGRVAMGQGAKKTRKTVDGSQMRTALIYHFFGSPGKTRYSGTQAANKLTRAPFFRLLRDGMEPAAGTPGRGDASSGPRKAPSISPNICHFSGLFGDGAHSGGMRIGLQGQTRHRRRHHERAVITRRLDLAAEHAVTFGPTARRSL